MLQYIIECHIETNRLSEVSHSPITLQLATFIQQSYISQFMNRYLSHSSTILVQARNKQGTLLNPYPS